MIAETYSHLINGFLEIKGSSRSEFLVGYRLGDIACSMKTVHQTRAGLSNSKKKNWCRPDAQLTLTVSVSWSSKLVEWSFRFDQAHVANFQAGLFLSNDPSKRLK